jgi:hypothetical protein
MLGEAHDACYLIVLRTLVLFFLLLVRIGAKPVPTPPSIESKRGWAHQLKTTKATLVRAPLAF